MSKSALDSASSPQATRGSLAVIFLTVFIDLLGFAMVLPLLPIYAEQFQTDESGAVIGLLMASFSAMQFLFAPLWGRLSDRIGRRPVLLIGLAGAAVCYALFGVATFYQSIVGLFASRIGAGIACATIPVAQAYIADTTTKENRAKGMALIGAAFGIGFCFGPLLGASAIWFSKDAAISPWPGFVAAALSGFSFLLALAILPESLQAHGHRANSRFFDWQALEDAFKTPSIEGLLLASFISVVSFGGFETTLSLLLKNEETGFALDQKNILFFFSYIGLVLSLVQGGLVRRLSGKWSEGTMATIGVILSLTGFVALLIAANLRHFPGLMLATAVEVSGFAFTTPSLQALISRRSDPAKQGGIAGVSQSISALARIAGPVFAMLLFKRNVLLPYIISAAMMVLAVLVLRVALNRGKDYGSSLPK